MANMTKFKLSEIISRFGGKLVGEDVYVKGVAPTTTALASDITFITSDKYKKELMGCQAGAIIVSLQDAHLIDIPKIITTNPYLYFSYVSRLFHPLKPITPGIKDTVKIGDNSFVSQSSAIDDYVIIGQNTKIGERCHIHPGVVIGDNVIIGDDVIIYPNVVIYDKVIIGNNCTFHAGAVIGSDGFGYAPDSAKKWHKIPQVGGVIIGNKVEIGANTTIDSGTLSPTIIKDGVIIDNLVQIAHNVEIGEHSAIAACAGIAGGTKIGKHCQIGGASNIIGQIEIADYSAVGGATTVTKSITEPGVYFSIYPFSSYKDWARNAAHVRNLDQMAKRLKNLEEELKALKSLNEVSNHG